jgi:hypothetical protein
MLKNDGQACRSDVNVIIHSLRLDAVDSSGGNTKRIEFAAYGIPNQIFLSSAVDCRSDEFAEQMGSIIS